MTTRQRNLLVLLLILGVAAAAFVLVQPKAPGDAELLAAVPRDSWLVATLDLRPLADSPVARPLASGGLTDYLGAGKVQELCGFDPLTRVRAVALAVPEGGEKQSWGLAFLGDIRTAELSQCARKMIDARGGSAKVTTRGVFTVIEDEASTATPPPRIAIREGGPLLAGQGGWLDTMMEASEGRAPRVTESAGHMKLREAIAARSKGGRAPALVVTAVLPKAMRERLKQEMGVELGDAGAGASAANAMMAGVLGIDTAGLAVTAGAAGEDSVAELDLTCESAAACGEVKLFLEKQRLRFSQSFVVRMLGLGPLIDSLTVSTDAAACHARATEPSDALASAIDRAMKSRSPSAEPPPPRPSPMPPPQPSAPLPDAATGEILHPARSDAGRR